MKIIAFIVLFLISFSTFADNSGAELDYSGTKVNMRQVIHDCLKFYGDNFNHAVDCLQNTYNKTGTHPESIPVHNFYILVDEIKEKYNNNQFTLVSAKAEVIRAHEETIEADNRKNVITNQNPQQNYQNNFDATRNMYERNQNYWNCLKVPGQICIP
jgi:hypothetical protein